MIATHSCINRYHHGNVVSYAIFLYNLALRLSPLSLYRYLPLLVFLFLPWHVSTSYFLSFYISVSLSSFALQKLLLCSQILFIEFVRPFVRTYLHSSVNFVLLKTRTIPGTSNPSSWYRFCVTDRWMMIKHALSYQDKHLKKLTITSKACKMERWDSIPNSLCGWNDVIKYFMM